MNLFMANLILCNETAKYFILFVSIAKKPLCVFIYYADVAFVFALWTTLLTCALAMVTLVLP